MAKSKKDERLIEIGGMFRKLRKEAGYSSQENFAYDHGISRIQYSRIESGANMQLKTFFNMLNIHGISAKEFFDRVEKERR